MKKSRKREIFMDFTSLLDVILIMLFWVMMNTSNQAQNEKEKAENSQIALAQMQAENSDNEEKLRQAQKEIDKQKQKARDINKLAAANQEALDDYDKGKGVIINIKYEGKNDYMYFFREDEKIFRADMEKDDTEESLKKAFELMGYKKEDVILCSVTYDGESVLDRDYDKLSLAVEKCREEYEHLYCTFINVSGG